MDNLTCIVCPIGCTLEISHKDAKGDSVPLDELSVSGNQCPRGAIYALDEICAPKRVVTATAPILTDGIKSDPESKYLSGQFETIRRVPVKTTSPCPKEKIPALLHDIYKTTVRLPVKTGDVIISCWQGEEIDVVATRTINR
jgi:CxxC motif-containing protein